jgi:hypothetical protein
MKKDYIVKPFDSEIISFWFEKNYLDKREQNKVGEQQKVAV